VFFFFFFKKDYLIADPILNFFNHFESSTFHLEIFYSSSWLFIFLNSGLFF